MVDALEAPADALGTTWCPCLAVPAGVAPDRRLREEQPRLPKKCGGGPRVAMGRLSLRRWVAITLAVCLLGGGPVAWSYFRALTVPGGGGFVVLTADWVRQIGLSREVAALENAWYRHHAPPVGGTPATGLSAEAVAPRSLAPPAHSPGGLAPPPPVTPVASPALPGEGHWQAIGGLVHGAPAMYAAYLRPDPVHTSLTAALVWVDPTLAALHLVAGSVQPGGTGWPDMAPIGPTIRHRLLATFNSGFRFGDSNGGYYQAGRTARPLVTGAASLVISQDGTATVGQWGRDVTMSATVAAVRQNLRMIVDGSKVTSGPYPHLRRSSSAAVHDQVLVWRSGVGVTASGALLYAAGPGLSVGALASLLQHAGAVRAMEMDINSAMVAFISFKVAAGATASALNGSKLLPGMDGGANRYLGPSNWDFLALVRRGAGSP